MAKMRKGVEEVRHTAADVECLSCVLVVGFTGKKGREDLRRRHCLAFTFSLFLSSDGFWVGKSSLRCWRQLALEQLDEQVGDADQSNGKMNGNTLNKGSV